MTFRISYLSRVKEVLIELYDRLPWQVLYLTEPLIKWAKILLVFFSEVKVDILCLRFRVNSAKDFLNIYYIGKKHQLTFLLGLVGSEDFTVQACDNSFFWKIGPFLEHPSPKAHIIIVQVNKILYCYLRPKRYLRLPSAVMSVLDLSDTFETIRGNFHENIRRNIRKVCGAGYDFITQYDESALKRFYHDMYVPYIAGRFGRRATVENYYKTRRLMRTGFLLLTQKDGSWHSGAICRIRNRTFVMELVGVKGGDIQLVREGALNALYYYLVLYAFQSGCKQINFGNSRPFLNDGLIQYKRKWGARIASNAKQYREVGIRINETSEEAWRFFESNYPIFFDGKRLSGVVVGAKNEPLSLKMIKHLEKAYFNPDLEKLIVLSPSGFSEEAAEHYSSNAKSVIRLVPLDSKASLFDSILRVSPWWRQKHR